MARQPRVDVVGYPQHVIVRGIDRSDCFVDDDDRFRYRRWMIEAAQERGVALHAFVFMSNHVHLMLTGLRPGAISAMMQVLGRRYVRAFNDRHGRSGPLFEGRFRSLLIESDTYALACLRYIDLNPRRARMVNDATAYPWSTCATHARGAPLAGWTPHASYLALASRGDLRLEAYRALLEVPIARESIPKIRPRGPASLVG